MSRFTRFSRISPAQLLRCRERTAWCSSGLTGVLLVATGCLLLQQVRIVIGSCDTHFHGIAYTEPESSPPPQEMLTSRSAPPPPEPQPLIPQPMPPELIFPDIAIEPIAHADEALPSEEPGNGIPLLPEIRKSTVPHTAAQPSAPVKTTTAAPLKTPHPPYPARMRQRRMKGDVGICIHIDAAGFPTAVDILTEVHPDFAEHTRRWILRHWRFRAAQQGPAAIASTLRTTIRYRLED